MTLEDQGNGFEAWRRFTELGQGGGRLRKVGLLNQILQFKFFTKDYMDGFTQFEGLVKQYDRGQPVCSEFDEDVKVATIVNGASGDLKKHLVSRGLSTYAELRAFILEYHLQLRVFVAPKTKVGTTAQAPDAMEVDYVGQKGKKKGKSSGKTKDNANKEMKGKNPSSSKSKVNKSGGKFAAAAGVGKGPSSRFEGYCGQSGKWGHKRETCWNNTANGQSGRTAVAAIDTEA